VSGGGEQLAALRLADDLTLPAEAVTETFAILAKRGAGKTYAAAVLVEEMVTTGLPVCVIDPVGVFYGLRSSADGRSPGLPVVILGGQHADLPLPLEAGAAVADLVIDERVPVVLDLSELSKRGQRRLVADFMEQLFRRNRDPLHVVVDEADLFAPQRGGPDLARLLGAYEDLVRRGRARGLGCTSITQRPAVLHKDILS
jgi:DNA helicase HerA-like ATPase